MRAPWRRTALLIYFSVVSMPGAWRVPNRLCRREVHEASAMEVHVTSMAGRGSERWHNVENMYLGLSVGVNQ